MSDPISRLELAQREIDRVFGQDFAALMQAHYLLCSVLAHVCRDSTVYLASNDILSERDIYGGPVMAPSREEV